MKLFTLHFFLIKQFMHQLNIINKNILIINLFIIKVYIIHT